MTDRITLVPGDPLDASDTLRAAEPARQDAVPGAAPTARAIYDSGVIIEFLAQTSRAATGCCRRAGCARIKALTLARLADGITEAAILVVYEGRFRDPRHAVRALADASARQDPARAGRLRGGAARSGQDRYRRHRPRLRARLSRLAQAGGLAADIRKLVAWLAAFAKNEPAFERTRAPTVKDDR